MKTRKMKVFWTRIDGERFSVAASREAAEALIRLDMKELQTKREEWSIQEESITLPFVSGELICPDEAWPFVRWTCPETGETLQSELEENETSPALFFTAVDGKIALVEWAEKPEDSLSQ